MPKGKSSKLDWSEISAEPEGWRGLQERARNEKDPRKLEAIIAEMNQLLNECEKKVSPGKAPRTAARGGSAKQTSIPE